jgi:hypothetical protein
LKVRGRRKEGKREGGSERGREEGKQEGKGKERRIGLSFCC